MQILALFKSSYLMDSTPLDLSICRMLKMSLLKRTNVTKK